MTREGAKALLPIIQAYSEGKTIEYLATKDKWVELEDPRFNYNAGLYRIKPEPRYRSFRTTEECFEEMKKHEPFGWVVNEVGVYKFICGVRKDAILFSLEPIVSLNFRDALFKCAFVDGEPFGVKEE